MNIAYIGLGSNIEPRKQYLTDAINMLEKNNQITVQLKSSIYETNPVGYIEQDKFLNMVVEVQTSLNSMELLDYCQHIEQKLGRSRTVVNGPRTIDLDILLFNSENRDLGTLRIPHPRLQERAFVLIPLCEIAPHLVLPTSGKRMEDLLERLPEKELNGVVKWHG